MQEKQPAKKAKKGVCRLHNTAPKGCPFGKECISPTAVQAVVPSTSTAEPPAPMPPSLGARVTKDSQALNRSCVSEKSLQNKLLNIC
jgi:hypothetical protein